MGASLRRIIVLATMAATAGLQLCAPTPLRVRYQVRTASIRCSDDDDMQERQRAVDEALAQLARKSSSTAEEPYAPPSPDLPTGAKVAVAGSSTSLGARMLRAIGAAGFEAVEVGAGADSLTADLSALVIISSAAGGSGGVELEAVPSLMSAIPERGSLARIIYLSVHGVDRTGEMPYMMQNIKSFGSLDKQRAGEQEVKLRALKRLPSCTIVRVAPGLVDDAEDADGRCELRPGDALEGPAPASAVGRVLMDTLTRSETINATFSLGALASAPSVPADAFWDDEFLRLAGPDIFRKPLSKDANVGACAKWLQTWAQGFLQ